MRRLSAATVIFALFAPALALAQPSRDAAPDTKQERSGTVGKATDWLERHRILDYLKPRPEDEDGFWLRVRLGGITSGAGFALGPDAIIPIVRRRLELHARGSLSSKGYRLGRANLVAPHLLGDRLELVGGATYRYFPQEDFWGLGPSSPGPRTNYLLQSRDYYGSARFKPATAVSIGVTAGYLETQTGAGDDPRLLSTELVFPPSSTPGLIASPDFGYATLFVDLDTRDNAELVHRGTHLFGSISRHADSNGDRYTFNTYEVEALQLVPFGEKSRLLFFGRAVSTQADHGRDMPFYMMPWLGGGDSLRSFQTYRFRDRSLAQVNAEYQHQVFKYMDVALFADAGDVAPHLRDLSFADFKTAYGVGLRFHTKKMMLLRIDGALAGTGTRRVLFRLSSAF